MGRRVDARDVLDANGRTRRAFAGRVVGFFRRTGPNSWDDYEFVAEDGGTIEVLPGLPVQVERHGTEFRMRSDGRVIRVAWVPADAGRHDRDAPAELRRRFLAECVSGFVEAPGQGAASFVARKLRE